MLILQLCIIPDSIFLRHDGSEHRVDFGHEEKRLFQVSDMLAYIDKYDYKYKNKVSYIIKNISFQWKQ